MNDRNNQYAQSMFTNMQNSEGGFFNNNPPPKLGEKSITENGTYTAKEDKLDGYSSVTADVAGGGGETFVVKFDEETGGVSKTLTESIAAFNSNKRVEMEIEIDPGKSLYAVAMPWDNNDDGTLTNLAFTLRSGMNGITVLTYVDETHVEAAFYSENE